MITYNQGIVLTTNRVLEVQDGGLTDLDGFQLTKMIAMEVFTYASIGCCIGCVLGLQLNKLMFEKFITEYFGETWHIPFGMLGIIIFIVMVSVVVAVYAPTKRIRNMDISACISEV